MLPFIENKLGKLNQVAGLELNFQSDGSSCYHLVLLERKKESLQVLKKTRDIKNLEALIPLIPSQVPIALVISGKGVLHKESASLAPNPVDQLNSVLPNADPNGFCFQANPLGSSNWISIIRREPVEHIQQELKRLDRSLIHFELGVFCLEQTLPLMATSQGILTTTNYTISYDNNRLVCFDSQSDLSRQDTTIDLATEKIPSVLLPAFAVAFSAILGISPIVHPISFLEKNKEDFIYNKIFRLAGWSFLLGLFGLLLINFIAFSWLNKQSQQQSLELTYHKKQLEQLNKVRKTYKEKEDFFSENTTLKPSRNSYYADQIGSSLPSGIRLLALDVFPSKANQQQRRQQLFLFSQNTIHIKGQSRRSTLLNAWIRELETLKWIKEVKVLPYTESVNGVGEFELEVKI